MSMSSKVFLGLGSSKDIHHAIHALSKCWIVYTRPNPNMHHASKNAYLLEKQSTGTVIFLLTLECSAYLVDKLPLEGVRVLAIQLPRLYLRHGHQWTSSKLVPSHRN